MSEQKPKRIVLTVTSDPAYDQRMIRICSSLQAGGYDVLLIGRERPSSGELPKRSFSQHRIRQRIDKGKLFYATYNLKLFLKLLFIKADCFCAIDLDTILPVYYASRLRRKPRVYDAHELFCEMEEVVSRPSTQRMWYAIEKHTVPNFKFGYTVNESYVLWYRQKYGVNYSIVRNATVLRPLQIPAKQDRIILYQGAVNQGRCFPELIQAMKNVPARLLVCGEGNFFEEAKAMTRELGLEDKIEFKGYVPPDELRNYTPQAYIGITLFVATSLSNELSLANRFFDYMHSGVPQLCMNYPEYAAINSKFEVAILVDKPQPEQISEALNRMLNDEPLYSRLQQNCLKAREEYCWQNEEARLLKTYATIFEGR
jgi:glycosyltransferase involved in cell wall biosynthesis